LLLLVYCSNYIYLFVSCMIARMSVCCWLMIEYRRWAVSEYYFEPDQQSHPEYRFDQGKYNMGLSLLPIHYNQ
jgi:hypothetical protein